MHSQLAQPLSENFSSQVTSLANEVQDGRQVARLAITGQGDLASGPGRLIISGTALVDRKTGLPVSETDESRPEAPDMTLAGQPDDSEPFLRPVAVRTRCTRMLTPGRQHPGAMLRAGQG